VAELSEQWGPQSQSQSSKRYLPQNSHSSPSSHPAKDVTGMKPMTRDNARRMHSACFLNRFLITQPPFDNLTQQKISHKIKIQRAFSASLATLSVRARYPLYLKRGKTYTFLRHLANPLYKVHTQNPPPKLTKRVGKQD